eukprot:964265-Amphidinium_carterae.2
MGDARATSECTTGSTGKKVALLQGMQVEEEVVLEAFRDKGIEVLQNPDHASDVWGIVTVVEPVTEEVLR